MAVPERFESWGRIEYGVDRDEFFAYVAEGRRSIVIDRPLSAGCLVTGRCNLKCAFCYGNDESLPARELTLHQWAETFKTLRSWGMMRVDISGGEPTMRKDVSNIARAAIDAGLAVVLSTNGLIWYKTGPRDLPTSVRVHVSFDSGISEVHESSRMLRTLQPSEGSLLRTSDFVKRSLDQGFRVRALTSIGTHNFGLLFRLAEHLMGIGVTDWNISRILRAGRAISEYAERWQIPEQWVATRVQEIQDALPWMRINYSNRTDQNGYFLLVLPDGTLATQFTDGSDKVNLGPVAEMTLQALQMERRFDLAEHGRKWLAMTLEQQPSVLE